VTVPEAFDAYLKAKGHLSAVHRQQILSVKHRFGQIPNTLGISEIDAQQIETVLSPLSSGSRNRYMRVLRAVWNYAIRKGWTKNNPINRLDFIVLPRKSVRIFSNEQITSMLKCSAAEHLEMLPYFALGAFAGLRVDSGEMYKFRWEDISFDENTIKIREEISKTGKTRFIPLANCLNAWLTLYLEKTGSLRGTVLRPPYGTLRKVRWKICGQLALSWIPAGLRHSYASAMINSGRGIDETCLALGHQGNPKMLWDHYYLVTTREQAEAYWRILP
jgi:integrase